MPQFANRYLFWSGVAAAIGAAVHLAIPVGGPSWYEFFGAPQQLVNLARIGAPYALVSCLVIATVLVFFAAYAFSGAGLIRRLPFLRTALVLIATLLILRGLLFVPLAVWLPHTLAGICDCRGVDTFLVVTSVICLALGLGYAVGARNLLRQSRAKAVPLQADALQDSLVQR